MSKNIFLNRGYFAGYLIVVLLLHANAILKSEDPIRDNQTEGILYDQKMEQEKDGVKAPATPRVVFYGGQGFLTKSSLAKNDMGISSKTVKKKDAFNWSDWWEDKTPDTDKKLDAQAVSAEDSVATPDLPTAAGEPLTEVPSNPDATVTDLQTAPAAPEKNLAVAPVDDFFEDHKSQAPDSSLAQSDALPPDTSDKNESKKSPQPGDSAAQPKGDDWW